MLAGSFLKKIVRMQREEWNIGIKNYSI